MRAACSGQHPLVVPRFTGNPVCARISRSHSRPFPVSPETRCVSARSTWLVAAVSTGQPLAGVPTQPVAVSSSPETRCVPFCSQIDSSRSHKRAIQIESHLKTNLTTQTQSHLVVFHRKPGVCLLESSDPGPDVFSRLHSRIWFDTRRFRLDTRVRSRARQ